MTFLGTFKASDGVDFQRLRTDPSYVRALAREQSGGVATSGSHRRAASGVGAPSRQPDGRRQTRSVPDHDPDVKVRQSDASQGSILHIVAHVGFPVGKHATCMEFSPDTTRGILLCAMRRSGALQGPPAMGRQLATRAHHTVSMRPPCPQRSTRQRGCRPCLNRRPRGRRPSTWPARPATARCLLFHLYELFSPAKT